MVRFLILSFFVFGFFFAVAGSDVIYVGGDGKRSLEEARDTIRGFRNVMGTGPAGCPLFKGLSPHYHHPQGPVPSLKGLSPHHLCESVFMSYARRRC